MGWFQKICRNAGLMVHNVKKPSKDHKAAQGTTEVTKHDVEEEKIDDNITLRRTTIEEVEMKPGADKEKLKQHQNKNESQQ